MYRESIKEGQGRRESLDPRLTPAFRPRTIDLTRAEDYLRSRVICVEAHMCPDKAPPSSLIDSSMVAKTSSLTWRPPGWGSPRTRPKFVQDVARLVAERNCWVCLGSPARSQEQGSFQIRARNVRSKLGSGLELVLRASWSAAKPIVGFPNRSG